MPIIEMIALSDIRLSWERVSYRLLTAQTTRALMLSLVRVSLSRVLIHRGATKRIRDE